MRLRALVILTGVALMLGTAFEPNWMAAAKSAVKSKDHISGDWDVTFELQGTKVPGTFKLKRDGGKVTGTANSQHTGPGTLSNGTCVDNKLSFTLNFAAHESIAVTGTLKGGKLSGEFRTEGMQGTWEATKKKK
ncbi:MAG: hypothetical protein QOF61_3429 [Acidobacteriota bacterium]|jgi:hypothetical protein|nr:hypothetical protein [Acidobacteriota bacterium]